MKRGSCLTSIRVQVPSDEVATCDRLVVRPWPVQRLILLTVHHRVLRHIDAEESLVQGEVDHIGVHRGDAHEHGRVRRQPGQVVAFVVPDVLEAFRIVHYPSPWIVLHVSIPHVHPGPALRAGGRGSRPGPPIPWGPIPGIYTVYCVVKRLRALSSE